MKKVLLIAGFAMCASLAFAQTAKINPRVGNEQMRLAHPAQPAMEQRVDYKASIFTKDDDSRLVGTVTFAANDGVTTGVIAEGDMINDTTVSASRAHAQTAAGSFWVRAANRAALSDSLGVMADFPAVYRNDSILGSYMSEDHGVAGDDGFMFNDPWDCDVTQSGLSQCINAWFQLPAMTLQAGDNIIDVNFHQFYGYKRYDECYIDYKDAQGNWQAFEINVTDVDVSLGGQAPVDMTVTLPSAASEGRTTLELRFRHYSYGRGADHGALWFVDDVVVRSYAEGARWNFNHMGYIDGFYGTVPEGFELPLAFAVNARNNGATDLSNVKLSVLHRYYDEDAQDWTDFTNVFTVDQQNIPAGSPTTDYLLRINERGFMVDSIGFNTSWANVWNQARAFNWPGYMLSDTAQRDSLGFQLRHLPTNHAGKNQFIIRATANPGMSYDLDTMTYTVSSEIGGSANDSLVGLTIPGYRWANDNGVIPSNSEFGYQFIIDNGQTFYTSDPSVGHQYQDGYAAYVRFNTPSTIPTDDQGNPWVIRGLEIIPSTAGMRGSDFAGGHLAPDALGWLVGGSGEGLYYLNTTNFFGVNNYTLEAKSGSDSMGFVAPSSNRYHAVNILFPSQPEIDFSMAYLFGYENSGGAYFSAARQRSVYRHSSDSSTYYTENPALADYANQFIPLGNGYSALMDDGVTGDNLPGYYMDWYPLIRLIVGPKMTLPQAGITLGGEEGCETFPAPDGAEDAEDATYWISASGSSNDCGMVDSVAKGGTYSYYIIPGYDDEENDYDPEQNTHGAGRSVIDAIYINGESIPLDSASIANDGRISRYSYDVEDTRHTEDWYPVMLKRYYYAVFVENIQNDVTISASAHWEKLGIQQELESGIRLNMAPNPATSQVRLNISGITGKVNCNIIDMSGRVVYNADINAENEHVINLSSVPAGAYFVRVTNDNFSKVEKLIVR